MEERKKYIVVLRANASIRIDGNAEIDINRNNIDFQIKIVDITRNEKKLKHYLCLQFEVVLEHTNIENAVQASTSITKFLLMLFSFSTSAHVEPPIPHVAYDITPGNKSREHIQYFFEPISLIPNIRKRILYEKNVDVLTKSFFKYERRDRIGRAIIWYTKFLSEDDDIARFSFLWIGMEALNPLLEKKLGSMREKSKCKECGYEEDISTPIGVKDFILKYTEGGSNLYRNIKGLRNEILHGVKSMEYINRKIKPLLNELENIIKKTILFLLEIDCSSENNWFDSSISNVPLDYIKHKSIINIQDIEEFRIKTGHPHFKADKDVIEFSKHAGQIEGTLRANLQPNFDSGFLTQHVEIFLNKEQKIITTPKQKMENNL